MSRLPGLRVPLPRPPRIPTPRSPGGPPPTTPGTTPTPATDPETVPTESTDPELEPELEPGDSVEESPTRQRRRVDTELALACPTGQKTRVLREDTAAAFACQLARLAAIIGWWKCFNRTPALARNTLRVPTLTLGAASRRYNSLLRRWGRRTWTLEQTDANRIPSAPTINKRTSRRNPRPIPEVRP